VGGHILGENGGNVCVREKRGENMVFLSAYSFSTQTILMVSDLLCYS
jgi:hypothetical protein